MTTDQKLPKLLRKPSTIANFSFFSHSSEELAEFIYRARAIITRSLYIYCPIFEDHFFDFKWGFSENSVLCIVSNLEGVMYVTSYVPRCNRVKFYCLTCNPSIYNIIRWFAGPMGQTNRRPSVWCSKYFFSIDSGHSKLFIFIFVISLKNTKINWNDFCRELCKILWKKTNTWNIRRLVNDSFVPSGRRTSLLNCKLTDF